MAGGYKKEMYTVVAYAGYELQRIHTVEIKGLEAAKHRRTFLLAKFADRVNLEVRVLNARNEIIVG